MKQFMSILLLISTAYYGYTESFTDNLQWLAKLTSCIGQYNSAETGDYSMKDPIDYYRPNDIREWLAKQSNNRTMTQTFYGICFDYAQWSYNYINQNISIKNNIKSWYIVGTRENSRQIILYEPVSRNQATVIMNGVPLKEISRQSVHAHGDATIHAWLWIYGKDGTIYWLDPTWTDNTGYIWWGVVRNGEEIQNRPSQNYCMISLPSNNEALANYNKGSANLQENKYDQAIADYTNAIRLDPNLAIAYCGRGTAYRLKFDFKKALADYNQALSLNANLAAAYAGRGYINGLMGWDRERGLTDLNRALQINPEYADAYEMRGGIYVFLNDPDKAIADYTQAIQFDPNVAIVYFNRAQEYIKIRDYDKAIDDFTQAIRVSPNFLSAYVNRGELYCNIKGNYDAGISDFTQAIKLEPSYVDPDFVAAYRNRGDAYINKEDFDRAISDFTQVIKLDPEDAESYFTLGYLIYYTKKDYSRAIEYFSEALRIDPEYSTARDALEAIQQEQKQNH